MRIWNVAPGGRGLLDDVVADACGMLNIVATGFAAQILGPRRLLISPIVRVESLFSYVGDERAQRQVIDSTYLGSIAVNFSHVEPSTEEHALFVELALRIDDGEAEALAIAKTRSLPLLTDDFAAVRLARSMTLETISVLDLLRNWQPNPDPAALRVAARSLSLRARFAPPKQHPLAGWYSQLLQ